MHYEDGKEVEFGITVRSWANTLPVDFGTKTVVSDGIRILFDPYDVLKRLINSLDLLPGRS